MSTGNSKNYTWHHHHVPDPALSTLQMEGSVAFPRPCPRQRGDPLLVRLPGTGWGRGGPAGSAMDSPIRACPGHPLPTFPGTPAGGLWGVLSPGRWGEGMHIHSFTHSFIHQKSPVPAPGPQRLGTRDPVPAPPPSWWANRADPHLPARREEGQEPRLSPSMGSLPNYKSSPHQTGVRS